MQVGLRGGGADRAVDRGFPRDRGLVPVDADRSGDPQVRGDELEVRALVAELIDRGAVEVARHQQVGERDRQQAPQLLGVCPCVADGCREQ